MPVGTYKIVVTMIDDDAQLDQESEQFPAR